MKKHIDDCMEQSLCPHCKAKLKSFVKVIKRPPAPNQNPWNEEDNKIEKTWSCMNCGFFGMQTTFQNRRKKKNGKTIEGIHKYIYNRSIIKYILNIIKVILYVSKVFSRLFL